MKKLLIAGAASLALSALPIAASFAVDPPAISDELIVTVGEACTFTRTSSTGESGTITDSIQLGGLNNNFGSSTYKAICNNAIGFNVEAEFTSLTGAGEAITYSATDPTAGSGTWTASVDDNNIVVSTVDGKLIGSLMSASGVTGANGISATVTYKISIRDNQAKGNYTGTATYTLNQNQ